MIIGIDFNNTIQDQIHCLVCLSGHKLSRQDFAEWDIPLGHKLGMADEDFIAWAWKNPAIQELASPFPGARGAIASLINAGHSIWIITSSFMPASKIANWFDRNEIFFHQIIKTKNKADIGVDLMIDDSPGVIDQFNALGRPILKFELPWNETVEAPGFSDWRVLPSLLPRFLK